MIISRSLESFGCFLLLLVWESSLSVKAKLCQSLAAKAFARKNLAVCWIQSEDEAVWTSEKFFGKKFLVKTEQRTANEQQLSGKRTASKRQANKQVNGKRATVQQNLRTSSELVNKLIISSDTNSVLANCLREEQGELF